MRSSHRLLNLHSIALFAFLLSFLSILATGARADHADETRPRNVRAVWLSDPCTAATIIWDTIKPTANNTVMVRPAGQQEFRPYEATANDSYSYAKKSKTELVFHQVVLEQMLPATKYEIVIESDGQRSRPLYFVTAPNDGRAITLLFGGDSRSDQKKRRAMNAMMAGLVESGEASGDPSDDVLGLIHAGDYVATGTDLAMWAKWLGDHELTVTSKGRLLPLIPARGNHDRGRLFNEAFGFDIKDQHNWYGVSFGNFLRIATLNTEASIAGTQTRWLKKELKTHRPKHHWYIAQYHRPGYAATKWPSGALIHWIPQFEKYNVDLVCEGDGHTIKRTVPIRKGKQDPTGVVYVGEGGLGVPPREPKKKRWYLQEPGMSDQGYHVQRLNFTEHKLTYECILLDGTIRDRWEKPK